MVDGDDFITLGDDDALREVAHSQPLHYDGFERSDAKNVRILNRYARWNSDGARSWTVSLIRQVDRPLIAPGKREGSDDPGRKTDPTCRSQQRSWTDMQKPTEHSMTNLERLGRYLKKLSRLVEFLVELTSTGSVVRLDVYGDSDHAGCLKTLASTTGMVLMRNAHRLKVSYTINHLTQEWRK